MGENMGDLHLANFKKFPQCPPTLEPTGIAQVSAILNGVKHCHLRSMALFVTGLGN